MATILIVDDNPFNRELIVALLAYHGHRMLEAIDGLDGLNLVHAESPDLIIADILMPTMNGFELVSRLRQEPSACMIPVIFYSATFHDPEMRSLAKACGVSRLLPKPPVPGEVIRLVNEALTSPDPAAPPAFFPEAGIGVVHLLNNKLFEKNSELLEVNAQLERRVRARTADLERANSQLQQQIQEHERTEAELRQAQRLDAVGRLAGGLAHDFNNLLAIILGQSERLIARSDDWETVRVLESIKAAVERGMSLTDQLLAFARQRSLETTVINFNEVLASVEKLLRVTVGEKIELEFQTEPALGNINANPSQLEQVLMNLAFNAKDAMPLGGKLTVRTANIQADIADEKSCRLFGESGHYVCVAVTDTGSGMDEKTQSQMFEPYFTTKETGGGTGLGLSTVYGIVKQSGGQILVYSEPDRGTTVNIYWPQVQLAAHTPLRIERASLSRDSMTILLVEDDALQLEVMCEFLEETGCNVLSAGSPDVALSLAKAFDRPIDLLVTDVIMPGMNGRELLARVRKDRPDIKVLFVSGYADDVFPREGWGVAGGLAYLQKPFTRQILTNKIGELMGSRPFKALV
jgi:signal transduction histidine kinase/DNA-binding LytR/AlgR family response regulator